MEANVGFQKGDIAIINDKCLRQELVGVGFPTGTHL